VKKLFVGNLPWTVDDAQLRDMFEGLGEVHSASVVMDRETGRSRGFGFVEMDDAEAQRAISELNGKTIQSRQIKVNEANPRPGGDRFRGGGGGGGDRPRRPGGQGGGSRW
jgi:RNA recognition motif-containing protein